MNEPKTNFSSTWETPQEILRKVSSMLERLQDLLRENHPQLQASVELVGEYRQKILILKSAFDKVSNELPR